MVIYCIDVLIHVNVCTDFQVSTYTMATHIFKGTHKCITCICVYLFFNYVKDNRIIEKQIGQANCFLLSFVIRGKEARMVFPSWTTL